MRGLAWNNTIGRVSYTIVQRLDLVSMSNRRSQHARSKVVRPWKE